MRVLADEAAIFLEEMNISGDEMIQMNHSLDDIPEDKIGAYNLHDIMAEFARKQLNLHGVTISLPCTSCKWCQTRYEFKCESCVEFSNYVQDNE